MPVDIEQLPIPDWGLHCPRCNYPLTGLMQHRCPECGETFAMHDIVPTWQRLRDPIQDGSELPIPDWGLHCPTCNYPLVGLQSHRCPECGNMADPQAARPPTAWFTLDEHMVGKMPLAGVESMLAAEQVPFAYKRDKLLKDIYFGQNMMGSRLSVPSEFYFEVLWLLHRMRDQIAAARADQGEWTCPQCNESVPGHFDLCWNCEAARPDPM